MKFVRDLCDGLFLLRKFPFRLRKLFVGNVLPQRLTCRLSKFLAERRAVRVEQKGELVERDPLGVVVFHVFHDFVDRNIRFFARVAVFEKLVFADQPDEKGFECGAQHLLAAEELAFLLHHIIYGHVIRRREHVSAFLDDRGKLFYLRFA